MTYKRTIEFRRAVLGSALFFSGCVLDFPDPAKGDYACQVDAECVGGYICYNKRCVPESTCVPDCTGRLCGPDPACGQSCGICSTGTCDDESGQCVLAPGEIGWSRQINFWGASSPAIGSDGTIYVGGYVYLYAINGDGAEKWRYATGDSVLGSPAIGSDGTIYFGSLDFNLYAVNPATGAKKWNYLTGGVVRSSPAISADGIEVYAGSADGYLYAIYAASGALRWKNGLGAAIYSSPAIGSDGTIYVARWVGPLVAVNPDGTNKWTSSTGGIFESSPAIGGDGTIYIVSRDSTLYAVDPVDGTTKWASGTANTLDAQNGSPAVGGDGAIYFQSADNFVYAIDASDGHERWRYQVDTKTDDWQSSASPSVAADGTIYVGSNDSNLYAIRPDGTGLAWKKAMPSSVQSGPAIAPDGTICVGSNDGKLYAVGGSSPLANSPWPKFHANLQNTGRR